MDDTESKVKKRVLPSWMTDDTSCPKKPCTAETTTRRKKKTQVSGRKRTVYCMNERELLEYALEILSQGKAQGDIKEESQAELQEDKEEPSPDRDDEKKPPISPGPEKPGPLPASPGDPKDDSDDDPLKYVREIFFS
ncbi:cell cycle regulator of non-homologous end joining isoform 2-T3 [Leptodactylus fuscus]